MPSKTLALKRLVIVGVPGTRRVAACADAAQRAGFDVQFVNWRTAIAGGWRPADDSLVRLESPSECAATARAILRAGRNEIESLQAIALDDERIERYASIKGAVVGVRQWFFGLRAILSRMQSGAVGDRVRWMSMPRSVAIAFDKEECLNRWRRTGLSVPPQFVAHRYDELRRAVDRRHARLFVKLRYGYGAIGAVALEWRRPRVRAITTIDSLLDNDGWLVSKRPRILDSESEIATLIDRLAAEEIVIEEWLPKARFAGCPFDVRVVVIDGMARHVVGRASFSPFTNLNLDARRISAGDLEGRLGPFWPDLLKTAERAAGEIDGAGMLGMDLLVKSNGKCAVVLEANAFGDYLPGLSDRGQTTYEAQFSTFARESAA